MNGFLLATDVVAETLQPDPHPKLEAWFAWAYERPKYLSVLTAGEMERAVRQVTDSRRRSQMVAWLSFAFRGLGSELLLPVTPAIAARWGQLGAIAPPGAQSLDLLIAATAAEHGLALVTGREKAFAGLGLDLVDPFR
ncbi:MAG: type II toxin-antitoxin system VapC family toxin [Acidobacteria bacterium]|nr:type II toxin-antitoxin system VapC family toxin [Acidobacteriota bacterium]